MGNTEFEAKFPVPDVILVALEATLLASLKACVIACNDVGVWKSFPFVAWAICRKVAVSALEPKLKVKIGICCAWKPGMGAQI